MIDGNNSMTYQNEREWGDQMIVEQALDR